MSARLIRAVVLVPAAWLVGASVLAGTAGWANADPPIEPLIFSEPLRAFLPKVEPTEAQRDRLGALSWYALARSMECRGDRNRALRSYQRSWRYDPAGVATAEAIVQLSTALGRPGEAVRCAAVLEKAEDAGHIHLRWLAMELTRRGDWPAAIRLYEKVLAGSDRPEADVLVWMELGRLSYLADDYAKAAGYFSQVLAAIENPRQFGLPDQIKKVLLSEKATAYDLAGNSFLMAGRIDDAIPAFEKSHQAKPDEARLAVGLSRAHLRGEQPEKALAELEKYLRENKTSEGIAAYHLLERILAALNRQRDLLPRIERLYAEDQENHSLGYFLAEKYLQADRRDEALALYTQLVRRAPSPTGYRRLLEMYYQMDRPSELLDTLAGIVEISGSLQTVIEQCIQLAEDNGLLDRVAETARSRLDDDSGKLGRSHRLAVALLMLLAKRYDTAGDFFELAVQSDARNKADLWLRWGLGMMAGDRFEEAAKVFGRAIKATDDKEERTLFHYYLAAALEMDDHSDRALAAARKAVELNGASPRFLSREAWILYRGDHRRPAAEAYRRLIEKFDDDYSSAETRNLLREARLVLSNLCIEADRTEEAIEWLEQVLDEFPQDVSALNDLGYLWADHNEHLERAHRMVRRAVDAMPENASYRDSLGWVLYRLGRFQEALAHLEQAAREKPDPVILDHLGDTLMAMHQPQRAQESWRKAIEVFMEAGREKEAEDVRAKLSGDF